MMETKVGKINIKLKDKYGSLANEFPIKSHTRCDSDSDKDLSESDKGDLLVLKIMDLIRGPDFANTIGESANISAISNNMFDIIVRIKGDPDRHIRGIQVKTLSRCTNKTNAYTVSNVHNNYPDDTLMIFCDRKMTKFILGYRKDFQTGSHLILFNFTQTNDSHLKFTNITMFSQNLLKLVMNATIIDNIEDGILTDNAYKEYKSLRMIKYQCEKRGIQFEYHYKSATPIDIFLNGHPCQCKFTSSLCPLLFDVHLSKFFQMEDVPYTDKDGIKFFIIQVGHPEDLCDYSNDICIIPTSVLIDQKRIKTDYQVGFKSCLIAPPDHADYHWCESMWNNYDLLKNSVDIIDDPIYNLLKRYKCSIINTSQKHGHKYTLGLYKVTMDDQSIDYVVIFINDKTERLYRDYVFMISKIDIIKENKTPDNSMISKRILICPPDYDLISNLPDWSLKYWKLIADL
jgi:hypothetical protein